MEQVSLRTIIRGKLVDGRLPLTAITRVWGGYGNGEECTACELIIRKDQFVMEGMGETKTPVQFHLECFYLWDAERRAAAGTKE
jgi:hypothetical protein